MMNDGEQDDIETISWAEAMYNLASENREWNDNVRRHWNMTYGTWADLSKLTSKYIKEGGLYVRDIKAIIMDKKLAAYFNMKFGTTVDFKDLNAYNLSQCITDKEGADKHVLIL